MGTSESPSVSVIIVSWNGKELLEDCLTSLGKQTFRDFEIIVVDNGSTDATVDLVRENFPEVRVIALERNTGFAHSTNAGISVARSDYIATLNNDTEPQPTWLEALKGVLDEDPKIGFCASKMVFYADPDVVDTCGDFYTSEGIPGKIGHGEPASSYDQRQEVFSACAGAAIYRRSIFEFTGGFDEDFFIIHEDSDLGFRARLAGFKCIFVPEAVVHHKVSSTIGYQSDTGAYYAQRNMEFMFFKNMPRRLLLKYLPAHLLADFLLFFRYLQHRQGITFLRAKMDALKMLPQIWKKRRAIQGRRQASIEAIAASLKQGWLREKFAEQFRRGG